MAVALFSCQRVDPETQASAMNLTINVNRALTRAVEDGHPGSNGDKISPKILAVTILSYDNVGVELGATDLTPDQIKLAIWGSYQIKQGGTWTPVTNNTTKPAGVKIGLPKGTTHVDVVVNRASLSEFVNETNINYFNYRDNKNGQNTDYSYGDDNFDRVVLTTDKYGKGAPLKNPVIGPSIPTYSMDFSVKPYMTRMEVHGGINVAPEEDWIDGYNNMWRTMTVTEYENVSREFPDINGKYSKGAVKGTPSNGFDQNTVYIPQYYWFREGLNVDEPVARDLSNSHENETDIPTDGSGWVKQPYYDVATVQVKWLPNRYYAVDVESVFINNVKVKGAERVPYMHQWPGSESVTLWPNWYKAFHTEGWHSTGQSAGNTFLCMGNMWDRISEANDPNTGYTEIDFPELNGVSKMQIITGKAKPTTDKSVYYDAVTNRNIGVAANKAAAYIIYPQSKQFTTTTTDGSKLRHELPHIILKVKVYENATKYAAGTYVNGKEFITLSLFSDAALGTGNYITEFKGGNIYRFNLNDLLYTFVGDVPVPGGKPTEDPTDPVDPDPEMPDSELVMTVKILEWVIQNIFPIV